MVTQDIDLTIWPQENDKIWKRRGEAFESNNMVPTVKNGSGSIMAGDSSSTGAGTAKAGGNNDVG